MKKFLGWIIDRYFPGDFVPRADLDALQVHNCVLTARASADAMQARYLLRQMGQLGDSYRIDFEYHLSRAIPDDYRTVRVLSQSCHAGFTVEFAAYVRVQEEELQKIGFEVFSGDIAERLSRVIAKNIVRKGEVLRG